MVGEFVGVKFSVVLDKSVPEFSAGEEARADELLSWCKRFADAGLTPNFSHKEGEASAGNLSFRCEKGFVITASGKNFSKLGTDGLVKVNKCSFEEGIVHAHGLRNPSSETFLHHLIYEARRDVNAVFHGHDEAVLGRAKELGLPVTPIRRPYGSKELAQDALELFNHRAYYVVLRGHGFVSAAPTMHLAGELALSIHQKASEL